MFVFMIAALTFALIMIFGYRMISEFAGEGQELAFVEFKTDLENSVKKIYTEYGAVRIATFNLPNTYSQICFVDLDYAGEMTGLKELSFDAYETWSIAQQEGGYAAVDQNVFLTPRAPVPLKVHQITIAGGSGYLCLPIRQGTFKLVLEGKGDHTELSPAATGN